MTSHLLAAAAAVGLLGAGFTNAGETRSFEAMTGPAAMFGGGEGGGADDKCRVDVIRSGSAGTADVSRQTFSDGSCVCTISTGPSGNNGSAEAIVSNLLRDRECAGPAPAAGDTSSAAATGASAGGGVGGGAVIGVLFGVAALGGGVAAGGGGKDSAG